MSAVVFDEAENTLSLSVFFSISISINVSVSTFFINSAQLCCGRRAPPDIYGRSASTDKSMSLSQPGAVAAPPLNVLTTTTTPNGFSEPPRGWNSFGLASNDGTNGDFTFDQEGVIKQCNFLSSTLDDAGYTYCSLDSGWSVGDEGDEYGRIIGEESLFDIPALADHLHDRGLKLGLYVLPGAFVNDGKKTIKGTNDQIGSVCEGDNGFTRCNFDFDKEATQKWHDSVVELFAQWGVDMIKLDYVTPGSPDNDGNLPADNSGSVIAYHNAIEKSGRDIRLDISWKLDRSPDYYDIWKSNADSMRTDQDINNSEESTFVSWETVQRAIDNYRQYIVLQVPSAATTPLTIYPDMDNLFVGNPAGVSGVTDKQRQAIMTHWIGAAANLIVGSDLTSLDDFGIKLLTDRSALEVADFTAKYPMQPRNPGTGKGEAVQLQAWIAGPSNDDGGAVVILANYGPDLGQGGFGTSLSGRQIVAASWSDLGISGTYNVRDVWEDEDLGDADDQVSAELSEGDSRLLKLTPVKT
ncbi:hypothetical protein FQN54_008029 [Arachnomyces sp. PD_36]|nr:hypothetical protein FQN54_008029 [Arachnomyces sp. PD_36]